MPFRRFASPLVLSLLVLVGCDDARTMGDAGPPDGGTDAGPPWTPACTEATPTTCTDQSFLDLNLFTEPCSSLVENAADGAGWESHVDATGGGFTPTLSYVYARFTDEGLVRVDVGDEAALDSMGWDIAFRRFIVRLNSGPSGPSCVSVGRTGPATDYDTLDAPPDSLEYRTEEYYTASCELVPDGSGLGSPGTAMQSFWEYPGCVKMTGNVYVLELANGRHLKLTFTSYYDPAVQETCDTTDSIDMGTPSGAGNIRLRWAFLD